MTIPIKSALLSFLLSFLAIGLLQAQDALGCNGQRYVDDVFEDIEMTTVQYGFNIGTLGNDEELFMDIYQATGDTLQKRPVIIFAHGGSYILGHRSLQEENCIRWAKKGYVTATIDYRLWNLFGGFPDSLDLMDVVVKSFGDMKSSVRFFRKNAAEDNNEYRIDSNFIFVGGYSAGGITAMHAGLIDSTDQNFPAFIADFIEDNGGLEGSSGNDGYSSSVQGILGMSGGIYSLDWIDINDPPLAMMHGTADETVPYEFGLAADLVSINGSALINQAAEGTGLLSYLYTVDDGGHTDIYNDDVFEVDFDAYRLNAAQFFHDEVLCTDLSGFDETVANSSNLKVWPNPAFDHATLSIEGISSPYSIDVFDPLGRCVFSKTDVTVSDYILHQNEIGKGWFVVRVSFKNANSQPINKTIIFY